MVKQFRVSGTWSRTYLAEDQTQANKYAQDDISMRNIHVDMNVQRIEEVGKIDR